MPAASALKVLVVDDQQTMRSLVRQGLQQLGVVDIREANDGEAGLRALLTAPANLVITDFNMPNVDGLELLRAIRAHPPFKSTAVIMLTGRADADLVKRAVQFGVNNYLSKPFTIGTLKEKIEGVFGALT
jgi:two-component system chemotaxis response regulator CheY